MSSHLVREPETHSFVAQHALIEEQTAKLAELKALSESSATKEDISRVRAEMKKLYDGLHVGEWTQDVLGLVTSSEQLRRILGLARACMGYP